MVVTSVLVAALVAVPGTEAASKPRFRVDMTVYQEADWQVSSQSVDLCSGSNVFNVYKGEGSGYMQVKRHRTRVSFTRKRGGLLQSSGFRAPAFAFREATYSSSREGRDDDCDPPPPAVVDTSACGLIIRRRGTARMHLLVVRGRLMLTGGFYEPNDRPRCPDASGLTGGIGYAGPARSRSDVDKLIGKRRVRSIELRASVKNRAFGGEDLSPSPGFDVRSAGGTYTARWKVKLTRLR